MKVNDLVRHKKVGFTGIVKKIEKVRPSWRRRSPPQASLLTGPPFPWQESYYLVMVILEDGIHFGDALEEWEVI